MQQWSEKHYELTLFYTDYTVRFRAWKSLHICLRSIVTTTKKQPKHRGDTKGVEWVKLMMIDMINNTLTHKTETWSKKRIGIPKLPKKLKTSRHSRRVGTENTHKWINLLCKAINAWEQSQAININYLHHSVEVSNHQPHFSWSCTSNTVYSTVRITWNMLLQFSHRKDQHYE